MEFVSGRDNFALTVFVPMDCSNNCPFCTTKKLYKDLPDIYQTIDYIKDMLTKANNSPVISDVVFTGGEPMGDIDMLRSFCKLVPKKNVYINTSLMKEGFFNFVKLVNETANIKGVSVSRHSPDPKDDPHNVVEDWCLEAFTKTVRVNAVIPDSCKDAKDFLNFVEAVLSRWNQQIVTVNFREDFRFVTSANLHDRNTERVQTLLKNYEFVSHGFCDVCDSMLFTNPATMQSFQYHRGTELSSIDMRSKVIVNDAIILPNKEGFLLTYDWDGSTSPEFEKFLFPDDAKKATRSRSRKTGVSKSPTSMKPPAKPTVPASSVGARCGLNTASARCGIGAGSPSCGWSHC